MEHHRKPCFEMENSVSVPHPQPSYYGKWLCFWLILGDWFRTEHYLQGIRTISNSNDPETENTL